MQISDFINLLRMRKSIRVFNSTKQISYTDECMFLDAGRLAPSAGNRQTWLFFVVKNIEQKQKIAQAACGNNTLWLSGLRILKTGEEDHLKI